MTFVKRMELKGFKSFANKISLNINPGFSTFVGSNGSGKSNVIDALCFVLGKMSKKSMRANMLSDLIFNGGKKGKSAQSASVSLVFDNAANQFPYEGNEFKISRVVNKDGNSTYKINDKAVKRQEILNSLAAQNIDPDGFNIILQGDIQRFVSMSPENRREIIDDVSGISVYEDKKRKSLRELDKVEDKLKEARTRLAERKKYLQEIINDKKQAEKYVKMKDELFETKAKLLFKKINDKEKKITSFDEQLASSEEAVTKMEAQIKEREQNILKLKDELTSVREELTLRGDAEQQALNKKLEAAKNQQLELKNVVSNHERELERISQREGNVKKELIDAQESIKTSKNKLKSLIDEINDISVKIAAKKKSSGVIDEERVNDLREQLIKIEEQLSGLNNELILTRQSNDYNEELVTVKKKLNNFQEKFNEVTVLLVDKESKEDSLIKKKHEVNDYLSHLKSEQYQLESKKDSIIDYAARGVKSVLKAQNKLKGIHGTITSLGIVDKNYITALNVAAGARKNAIVTTDDLCAQQSIEYLRQNQLGTATFIPLNKIKCHLSLDKNLKKIQGVIDYAINLIRFDEKYHKAFELVLGDTLIVHDLETARKVGFSKARMVTLKGDLIDKTGFMTGGYRGKSTGFQSKDLDEELETNELNTRKYERYKKELTDGLSVLREEVIKAREEKARLNSLIKELTKTVNKLEPKINNKGSEPVIQKEIERLVKQKESIKKELTNTNQSDLKELKKEISSLEAKQNELVISKGTLESELNKVLIKESERLKEILESLASERKEFKKEKQESLIKLKTVKDELRVLAKEEEKFYSELKHLYDQRDELSKKIEDQKEFINDLEKKSYKEKESSQGLRLERASIVAQLEGLKEAFKEFSDWKPVLSTKTIKDLDKQINKLEVQVKNFGPVNMKSIETYKEVEREFDEVKERTEELTSEKEEVLKIIDDIEDSKRKAFKQAFDTINNNFSRIFANLSPGGIAKLELEDREEFFNGGVIALVRPKGKKILTLKSMSGGEKTLTALAFIFAIQDYNPTPFYVMDEVDAALDKANTEKLAELISEHSSKSQFIMISHNDELISASNYLYGVSMNQRGVSNIVSLELPE